MEGSGDGREDNGKIKVAYRQERPVEGRGDRLLSRFRHQDWAKRIALMLLEIEHDEFMRLSVENILIAIVEQARAEKKQPPHLKIVK